jgi:hypothetical protein
MISSPRYIFLLLAALWAGPEIRARAADPVAPVVRVAAADAGAEARAQADQTAPGTRDETVLQAALDAVTARKGRVVLSAGTFTVSAPCSDSRGHT